MGQILKCFKKGLKKSESTLITWEAMNYQPIYSEPHRQRKNFEEKILKGRLKQTKLTMK